MYHTGRWALLDIVRYVTANLGPINVHRFLLVPAVPLAVAVIPRSIQGLTTFCQYKKRPRAIPLNCNQYLR